MARLEKSNSGLLHLNGLFIILGVGVDDAFVIMDAYGQEQAEAAAEGRRTSFRLLEHSKEASHEFRHDERELQISSEVL